MRDSVGRTQSDTVPAKVAALCIRLGRHSFILLEEAERTPERANAAVVALFLVDSNPIGHFAHSLKTEKPRVGEFSAHNYSRRLKNIQVGWRFGWFFRAIAVRKISPPAWW
jgi:hypothetical protein